MLVVQRLSVRRGRDVVVQHATLRVGNPGLLFVVGTGGAGKSSLLATLAGAAASQGLQASGTMELDGRPLDAGQVRASWVAQHACVDTPGVPRRQRREEAVLAGLARDADIYLVDEPCSDLDRGQQERIRARLADLARRACVVVATHNRQDCLSLGGLTALLAGGTIQECAESARFFEAPATAAGRTYVETGNCNLPLEARLGKVRDGIWWLVPGLLCGMSRPGLTARSGEQFHSLVRQGVRHLVCLEERCTYPLSAVRGSGLAHLHFPVPDMAPPSFNQAVDLCRAVEAPIRANEGVALHCRGGLGRTGTALATILAWFGDDADAAIAKVRRANPLAIQSMAQLRFVHEFADRIRGWHVSASINKEMSDVVG